MNNTTRLMIGSVVATFGLVCAGNVALAQDKGKATAEKKPAAADAKAPAGKATVKKVLENDRVLVTEITFKPGEGSSGERSARVTRAMTDGTMERTYADGKKETLHWKAGEVRYFPKETFDNKNIGKKDMVFFVTNLK